MRVKRMDKKRSARKRTTGTAFKEFIFTSEWNPKCTGVSATKKSGPFWGHPFKEAIRQESEETQFGAVSGEETTGEKSRNRKKCSEGCGLFITG
jgi:hypothetical protein